MAATDVAVPHDSAVSTGAGRASVQHLLPPAGTGIRTRFFMLSNCGDDRPRHARASGSSTSPSSPSRTTTPAHAGIGQVMSDVQFQSFLNSSFTTISMRGATVLEPEADRSRCGVRPISSRKRTDLDAGCDRSRAGSGPISMRGATDLEPELDRSRHGVRPISVRNRTDLDAEYDRSRRLLAVTPVRDGRPRA